MMLELILKILVGVCLFQAFLRTYPKVSRRDAVIHDTVKAEGKSGYINTEEEFISAEQAVKWIEGDE